MRRIGWVGLLVAASAANVVHCVGDAGPGQDGGPDADLTGTESHACFANSTCDDGLTCISKVCVRLDGGSNDAAGDVANDALVDAPFEVSADAFDVQCGAPSNCTPSSYVCCLYFSSLGQAPTCTATGGNSACVDPSKCPSDLTKCGAEIARGCAQPSDCIETGYDHCCTNTLTPLGPKSICMSSAFAQSVGATCP